VQKQVILQHKKIILQHKISYITNKTGVKDNIIQIAFKHVSKE